MSRLPTWLRAAVFLCGVLWLCPLWAADAVRIDDRARGQANAPVTLIEYSDFTCGYCLKFFKETWPRIQARYVDTGKVRFLYRDYPRADQGPAVDAATAARCAGAQGKYWPMHDRLFAEGGRLGKDVYLKHAAAIGLDRTMFNSVPRTDGIARRSSRIGKRPISGDFTERLALSSFGRTAIRRTRNRRSQFPGRFRSKCSPKKSTGC